MSGTYKRVLVVDDEEGRFLALRNQKVIPPTSIWASDGFEGIDQVENHGPFDEIMLDHDLKTFETIETEDGPIKREITGRDVASAIARAPWKPELVIVHSMNPNALEIVNILKDAGIRTKRILISSIVDLHMETGEL